MHTSVFGYNKVILTFGYNKVIVKATVSVPQSIRRYNVKIQKRRKGRKGRGVALCVNKWIDSEEMPL